MLRVIIFMILSSDLFQVYEKSNFQFFTLFLDHARTYTNIHSHTHVCTHYTVSFTHAHRWQ